MRIVSLSIIIITSFTFSAYAQIKLGIKAGYNLTNLNSSGSQLDPNYSYKSDFNAGILVSIPLFSTCSLQPEIVYSGQGAIQDFAPNPQSATQIKYYYNYLNVPVLFKYRNSLGFFAETGPQIGFLLSAKRVAPGGNYDEMAYSKSPEFSWVLGMGYKIPKTSLGINARYNLGLTGINTIMTYGTIKNCVFQFGIFYLF